VCWLWQFKCAVHTRCSSDCDLIASCYSCVPYCIQADVGIVLVRILSQNCCLLLLAATLLPVQAVTWVGSINTTNIPTKSGNQQLSDKIMTPHLQVQHPSLNLLSFQLSICLTQLYIVPSVESAVLINTSSCCFTSVWYCLLNCFLCGLLQDLPSSGSSATTTVIVGCTSELYCTGVHVYRATDALTRWYAAFSADGGVNTGHGLGGPYGIPGETQLWWWPAKCEHNIQHSAVHTALL